jgi:hypothetical protein
MANGDIPNGQLQTNGHANGVDERCIELVDRVQVQTMKLVSQKQVKSSIEY